VWFELNADGVHVTPDCLRLCAASLNPERMVLISDAVIAAGTAGGSYEYLGRPVVSGEQGVRYADSDILIGSRMLLNEIVRNFIATTGVPVHAAVRAATYNPCCVLGLEDRRGSLEVGKEADVVVFDNEFNVKHNLAV
jgi:N-acetylglucosamine-6-phosphate deacetylase